MATNTAKKTTTTTAKPKEITNDLENENKKLKLEFENLKKLMESVLENQRINTVPTEGTNLPDVDDIDDEIKPNKYIKVMSLLDHRLNLSTQGYGKGKIFVFNKFGEVKNIVYSDLAEIIHNQQAFAERGDFYITDKTVIRRHGLDEYYKNILTKDMIENILNLDSKQMASLFKNATESNQETVVSIIIRKLRNEEDVDLNKVDALSRIYGKNINELAQDSLENDSNE